MRTMRSSMRLVAVFVLLASAVAAQGIRLVTVPDAVRLPAAAGQNLVLEAAVGGEPSEVWLATAATATDRVRLVSAGADRWQVNLADPRVAELLPTAHDGGALFVFARIDGRTTQSAAVIWARATRDDGHVLCFVRRRDGTTRTVVAGTLTWLDLANLDRLELQGVGARQTAAVAQLGEVTLPLQRREADGTWVLACDETTQRHLRDADALQLEAKLGSGSVLFRFALVPARLELEGGAAEFVVQQRREAPVPGSRGWLTVQIDDITMGSTFVRVVDGVRAEVVATLEMFAGDFVPFALADERYVLVVERLRNQLIGEDRAVLRVLPERGFRPNRIAQLVRAVGKSPDAFVREGVEYDGATAKQFLVAKVTNHKGDVTLEHFLTTLASVSGQTGEAYHVRRVDGSTTTMEAWLRAALATIEAEERKAATPPAADPARR